MTLKQAAENAASCMGEKKEGRENAKEIVMNWIIVLAVALSVAVGACARPNQRSSEPGPIK